ncbi:MAG: hypothetical protein ACTSWY_08690 [Promethearchaeota archaeon]
MFWKNYKKKQRDPKIELKKKYIKVPGVNSKADFNLVLLPFDEDLNEKGSKKISGEELISRELLMSNKERYLSAAVKYRQFRNNKKFQEKAFSYFKMAAMFAEKLGLFSESEVYFNELEKFSKINEKSDENLESENNTKISKQKNESVNSEKNNQNFKTQKNKKLSSKDYLPKGIKIPMINRKRAKEYYENKEFMEKINF